MQPPQGLPEPVLRYFQAMGNVPRAQSAVVWGRGRIQPVPFLGLWMPVSFVGYYLPGREFCRYMEITWFGLPVLYGRDSYLDGRGLFEVKGLGSVNLSQTEAQIILI